MCQVYYCPTLDIGRVLLRRIGFVSLLVFIPTYRRRVLDGAIAARVQELFEQASEVNDWQIHEMSIQTDH
jgi:hypothetical protein